MRHFIVLSLLIASFHADAQSKPAFRPEHSGFGTTGGNELQIRQLLDEQTTAWNRGDIESFMKGYWENDSLMFIGKGGVTYGWINTLNNYKKIIPTLPLWANLVLIL